MLVGELKQHLEQFEDNVEVVVMGHYGEGIRMMDPPNLRSCHAVVNYYWDFKPSRITGPIKEVKVCALSSVDVGNEPW